MGFEDVEEVKAKSVSVLSTRPLNAPKYQVSSLSNSVEGRGRPPNFRTESIKSECVEPSFHHKR